MFALIVLAFLPSRNVGATLYVTNYSGGAENDTFNPPAYYIPIKVSGICDNAIVRPLSAYKFSLPLDASATSTVGPVFEVTTEKTAKDISGKDDVTNGQLAIYAEYNGKPLTLFDADGQQGYNQTSPATPNYLNFPLNVSATASLIDTKVHVGVRFNPISSYGAYSNGLCALLPTTTYCTPTVPGSAVNLFQIKIGIVSVYGNSFNGFNANPNGGTLESKDIQIGLSACPPGTDATGPKLMDASAFYTIPSDGKVRLVVPSLPLVSGAALYDSTGLHHVVGYADTAPPPMTYAASEAKNLIRDFDPGVTTGTFMFTSLANDQPYYFSIGYVNYAGFVTTGTGGTSSADLPNPQQQTPMQIAGFLDHSTCFVATAAYGTELEPKLSVLREFRDKILAVWAPGRAFVRWYYSWSARAATWLSQHEGYKTLVRIALAPTVEGARFALWLKDRLWIMAIILVIGTAAVVFVTIRRERTT